MELLTTKRLTLLRLDESWMERFAADSREAGAALEHFLGYPESGRCEHPVTVYRKILLELSRHPENACWHCLWEILLPEEKRRIGGFLFKGPPDALGQTELGYGIDEPFRGRGFATEAAGAAIDWAFAHGAGSVTAKINPGNAASRRVLEKLGMEQYQWIGKMPCFRMMRDNRKG